LKPSAVWRQNEPTVIVLDASALLVALADDGPDGVRARDALQGERLIAPQLVDLEMDLPSAGVKEQARSAKPALWSR
jgi:hypothetical protein